MILKQYAAPAIEPVSLQDMKEHLRLDSGALIDNLDPLQSIYAGSHGTTTLYSLLGAFANVLGYSAVVILDTGVIAATGILDVKIQESDDALKLTIADSVCIEANGTYALIFTGTNITPATGTYTILSNKITAVSLTSPGIGYSVVPTVATQTGDGSVTAAFNFTDWNLTTGGAFTTVTPATTVKIQQIAYTGSKQYVRVVAQVVNAACEFGVQVAKYASDTTEDTILSALITAAREQVEAITQRALIIQTFDAYLDEFPDKDFIPLPFGNLQDDATDPSIVPVLTYKDSAGAPTAMTVATQYLVEMNGEAPGRIVLPYGVSWPSPSTLYPSNPITIRFSCGYGATAASVPTGIRTAIKMLCESLYNDRSATHNQGNQGNVTENKAVLSLLYPFRIWGF